MTTKFISLATGIVLLDVYLQSQLSSNDPLFLFASSNIAVNVGLMIIVSLMVGVSFRKKFRHWWTFVSCLMMAGIFGTVGFIGLFFSDLLYSFPQILQPLDYLFLLEAGVVFGVSCLTYQHQKVPEKFRIAYRLPQLTNIALPVPRIPQSPNTGSRGASPA